MKDKIYHRYCAMEAMIAQDEEYCYLKQRLEEVSPGFESAVSQLTPQAQAAVTEYLGILAEIQQRITELAAFME